MSDAPMTDDKRPDEILAGELALNLLEGEELLMARGRMAREPQFVDHLAWWHEQLAPMADNIAPIAPPADLWTRIETAIADKPDTQSETAQIVSLKTRLRNWQIAGSAAAMAAVASLALVVLSPTQTTIAETQPQAPLVASLPIAEGDLRLAVTYLPDDGQLLVSANGLTADGVHDHELWVMKKDGSGVESLGVIVPGEVRRVTLPAGVATNVEDGAAVLLSREPLGGKPEGVDPGPIVAQGAFTQV